MIEAEGIPGCDEFSYLDGRTMVVFSAGKEVIAITAVYFGSWGFAVTSRDEESDFTAMPDWPIRRKWGVKESGRIRYSETLEIDVPDDAELVFKAGG